MKLVSGEWPGFFYDFLPTVGGALFEGKRPFKVLIAGPTTLNNLFCHDFRELWVWACDAAARPAMLCAMVASNFLSAAW